MSLVKVIELVASSPDSWEGAVQAAIKEVAATVRHIRGVDVIKQSAHVENGKIIEYRATVHIAFLVEAHKNLAGV